MTDEQPLLCQLGRRWPVRVRRQLLLGTLGWVFTRWALSSVLLVRTAAAMCVGPGLTEQAREGSWINVNPKTESLRRVKIQFVCNDVTLGPDDEAWAGFSLHAFCACGNGECDWDWSRAESLPGGLWYGAFKDSDATRHLFVRMSPYGAAQLEVYIWTDFLDEQRQDYGSWDWLKRAAPSKPGASGVPADPKKSLERNTDHEPHAPAKRPALVLAALSRQLASGPAAEAAPFPEDPAPPQAVCRRDCRCKDLLYVRLSNDSSMDFVSARVDGLEFGPLRAQALSDYQRVKPGVCVRSGGKGYVTTDQGRIDLAPFNPSDEAPLLGEYYTRRLMNVDAKSHRLVNLIDTDVPPPYLFDAEQAQQQLDGFARVASRCGEAGVPRGARSPLARSGLRRFRPRRGGALGEP